MSSNKLFIILFLLMLGFVSPALAKYGVQTKTSHCAVSNGLPDSACTPGAVFSTSTDLICDKNYLKNVLNVTPTVQKKVFAEYNLSYKLHDKYKLDHIISLELGGSNNISNLWPEADNLTNSSQMKDKLTAYLHDQVCKGNIDISEAQKEISSNWVTYYKKYLTTPKTSPASDNTAATSSASSTNISNGKIIAANTCTSWTYTDWTPCSFFGNQTREILSSLPTGCSGGNYVLEKECITPFDLATTTAESIVAATTTSSGFDNLLLGVAFLDNGKNVGLSCKPWVNKVFSIASKNSSTLPFMQDNNYSWGLSSSSRVIARSAAISNVKRADIIQFNIASKNNLPHTAIVISSTPTGMVWIHSNWQKALTVSVDFITYQYFNALVGSQYSIYHLY